MTTGKTWEAQIAHENQRLLDERRAMVARVPTHYHDGIPSHDPKVDFVGVLDGGRMVAIEAKAESGALTRTQRAYLQGVAMFGGLALVYRIIDGERHLCAVDERGIVERKSKSTRVEHETWLDAADERWLP